MQGPTKMSIRHEKAFQKFRLLPLGHMFSSYLISGGAGGGKVSFWHLGGHIICRTFFQIRW